MIITLKIIQDQLSAQLKLYSICLFIFLTSLNVVVPLQSRAVHWSDCQGFSSSHEKLTYIICKSICGWSLIPWFYGSVFYGVYVRTKWVMERTWKINIQGISPTTSVWWLRLVEEDPALYSVSQQNNKRWPNVVLIPGHRLRRWPSIETTFGQRLVFAGMFTQ